MSQLRAGNRPPELQESAAVVEPRTDSEVLELAIVGEVDAIETELDRLEDVQDAFEQAANETLEADAVASLVQAEPAELEVTSSQVLDPRDRSISPPLFAQTHDAASEAVAQAEVTEEDVAVEEEPVPTPRPVAVANRRVGGFVGHIVEPGDNLSRIAARFNISAESLRLANGLEADAVIQVGQALRVPTIDGPVHVVEAGETLSEIALRYGVDAETVIVANDLQDSTIVVSQRLIIPGGVRPPPRVIAPTSTPTAKPTAAPARPTPQPTARPAAQASSAAAPARPTAQPTAAPQQRSAPRSEPASTPAGSLVWPINGTLTQRFGENGHRGIDVAAPVGTPIRAAAAGTVRVAAKLSYGYGWRIIIDHGKGVATLYAHLSSFSVEEGARVSRGQVIGGAGSTGFSTGPHLHFEVQINGQVTDPLKYLP